jgi:hypothetical protein
MNKHRIVRIVSVLIGAAVVFGLEQGLGLKIYIAIPAGIVAYAAVLFAFALLARDTPAA